MKVLRLSQLRKLLLFLVALNTLVLCFLARCEEGCSGWLPLHPFRKAGARGRPKPIGYRIRTPGCTVPEYDPFDPSILPYFRRRSGGHPCRGKPNILRVGRNGHPALIEENLRAHTVLPKDVRCSYRGIYRNESSETPDDGYVEGPKGPLPFDKPLTEEFVFVECSTAQSPDSPFHTQFLLNPLLKEHVEKRWRGQLRRALHNLSVLVLGMDSVSHLNLYRHLPETTRFLREQLGAFELCGYNKIGLNSFPNQVALITGLSHSEADGVAVPDRYFDRLTARLIWNRYGERGHRSMFLEEGHELAIFNMGYRGFRHPPADYYLRPVITAMDGRWRHNWERVPCLGNTMPFEELLDYLARFTRLMEDRLFFAHAWLNDVTHDVFNNAGYADAPVRWLLQSLRESGVLNRTILVFLSDHGIRYGDARTTYIGKLEDRQPFAFLAFPPWFLRAHPEAARSLRVNQRRLTTPFDVHATLVELLDYPLLERPNTTYGLSLLHEVPNTRTCADAAISLDWCMCNVMRNAVEETLAASLANYLLSNINAAVRQASRHCSQYRLLEISDVTALQPTAAERSQNVSHYLVTIKVSPGEAVFEGTARVCGDVITEVKQITRGDHFNRLSYCVHESWHRHACHCRRTFWEVV
ncbi:uncharacterized protein LOC144146317 [Haemaphysalis longicornis]